MTTSAIRFHGESLFVADPELREFIKAVAYHLPAYARDNAGAVDWLAEACAGWMNTHEDFPPGLRDLELDEVLTTQERFTVLAAYLTWLKLIPASAGTESAKHSSAKGRGVAAPSHTYDVPTARRVIERFLTKWPAQ